MAEKLPLPAGFALAIGDFLQSLRIEAGRSRATLVAYRRDLERFARWAIGRGDGGWTAVDQERVLAYLGWMQEEAGYSERTRARSLAALRGLFGHLVREGERRADPCARLETPKIGRALPKVLSQGEVERLLAAVEGEDWRCLRARALLEVLYGCGARVSEACGLKLDDLPPGARELRLFGKGERTRIVPLGARARAALVDWLEHGRGQVPGAPKRRELLLGDRGGALSRGSAWRIVERAARRAGLPVAVSPHVLRHAYATHLVRGGADLRSVQELLGHASIRTTEIYTHLDAGHVRDLHRRFHPRG